MIRVVRVKTRISRLTETCTSGGETFFFFFLRDDIIIWGLIWIYRIMSLRRHWQGCCLS